MTALVILGGVKAIGHVAGLLVPFMALFYIVGGLIILVLRFDRIPAVLMAIWNSAWGLSPAVGGFSAAALMAAIQLGVSRSVFSNEAGLGISSIAAAAAKTDSPARQAMITMTGALISTVIVCTITGLVLGVTGVLETSSSTGAALAIEAFSSVLTGGQWIVTIGLILFAYSTVLAWGYYGEKCFEYLFGDRFILIYRILFILLVIPGAALQIETAWVVADIANGLMAIPNLIALVALAPVIKKETIHFLAIVKKETADS